MCGIAGAWLKGTQADAAGAVWRAASMLTHRGPDDAALVEIPLRPDGMSLVFGHTRLSIIDLSRAGRQPMVDPETGNWIIFNGEVYNFQEIRRELEQQGCRFRSCSDTEVILLSYRVWGRNCIKRWRGMFAAAIWDARRQELFLVRDRLGVKPLYYYHHQNAFLFASELRALLATGLVARKVSPAGLNTFLMFGAVQDPLSLIDGVLSLPAAHTLTVSADGAELQEYWELPVDAAVEKYDAAESHGRAAALLQEAVRLRLISDVPLGVFLSGGVDSSAIAMLARRNSPEHVKTFTIGFVNEKFNEAAQAQRTAASLGVEHHSILLTEDEMLASCNAAVDALDQPSIDGINTFYISRAVKEAGIKVALSGVGGDEAFCGYKHFNVLPRLERFERHRRRVPYVLRQVGSSMVGRLGGSHKLRALLLDDYGFEQPYFLVRTLLTPEHIATLLEREIVQSVHYGPWATRLRETVRRAQELDPVNRISYLELKTYIPNTLLRDADVMSMAHSLEIREPLLDHLLLEELMRIPGAAKLTPRMPKPLLVRSLPETLPADVISAPKRGFTLPFSAWLPGQLRERVEESFNNPPPALDGILNQEAARGVWASFLAGHTPWTCAWGIYVLHRVAERILTPDSPPASVDTDVILRGAFSSLPV